MGEETHLEQVDAVLPLAQGVLQPLDLRVLRLHRRQVPPGEEAAQKPRQHRRHQTDLPHAAHEL